MPYRANIICLCHMNKSAWSKKKCVDIKESLVCTCFLSGNQAAELMLFFPPVLLFMFWPVYVLHVMMTEQSLLCRLGGTSKVLSSLTSVSLSWIFWILLFFVPHYANRKTSPLLHCGCSRTDAECHSLVFAAL